MVTRPHLTNPRPFWHLRCRRRRTYRLAVDSHLELVLRHETQGSLVDNSLPQLPLDEATLSIFIDAEAPVRGSAVL